MHVYQFQCVKSKSVTNLAEAAADPNIDNFDGRGNPILPGIAGGGGGGGGGGANPGAAVVHVAGGAGVGDHAVDVDGGAVGGGVGDEGGAGAALM